MRKLFFFTLFIFQASFTFSDTGCLLPDGNLYSPKTGQAWLGWKLTGFPPSPDYGVLVNVYDSPQVSTSIGNCPGWANNISYTGNKCATKTMLGVGLFNNYLLANNEGVEVTFDFVECSLDDYTYLLGLVMGAVALMVIRKRNKF